MKIACSRAETPRESFPIFELRERLKAVCAAARRVVLQAPTGSGKSTQIPQFLIDDGIVAAGKKVVILQPRRLPTRMLAARIAAERGQNLGDEVGYQIRFDRVESAATRIKFVTEGLLLRQMIGDNNALDDVGAVIFDEFHERHLYSDITLAMARKIQESTRPDLLIIVMSATLDVASLEKWLAPCEKLTASGRTFPVEIEYSAATNNSFAGARQRNGFLPRYAVWEHAAAVFRKIFHEEPEGDFLIFMPGGYEIAKTIAEIAATPEGRQCAVLPLYGELSAAEQDRAVAPAPAGTRKVVVATNVAETSLTIPGVRVVIDSGLARIARHDPHRGINMLLIEPISQSSADQRAGRAGRTAPGRCVRLWSRADQNSRAPRDVPELLRLELSETALLLKSFGINDLAAFPWFEAPPQKSIDNAEELLRDLGALDHNGALTELGRQMAAFPLHPRYSRMMIAAQKLDCSRQIAMIAALSQGRDIMLKIDNKRLATERDELLGEADSDFSHRLTLLGMARRKNFDHEFCRKWGIHSVAARQADKLAEQFLKIAEAKSLTSRSNTPATTNPKISATTNPASLSRGIVVANEEVPLQQRIARCVLLGFVSQLARRIDEGTLRCRLVHGRVGELRKTSAARRAKLFVAAEIDEIQTRGEVTVFLDLATAVEESWLEEYFPNEFSEATSVRYDAVQKRVLTLRERSFRGLVLATKLLPDFPSDEASKILAEEILAGRLRLEDWDERVEAWIRKVNFAAKHCPELEIATIDADARRMLVEEICLGATSYKDIRNKPVWETVRGWTTREQAAAIAATLPDTISLPHKKHPAKICYTEDCEAVVSATVQELYDADGTKLRVCGGRVPLVIEVQSPARRTFQRTSDLDAFWKTSYESVKKELKGRYPKHEWR